MQGKGKLAWDTWPNRLVLRLSLQSGNKTNYLLKSGPDKAGPAGPAMPPLHGCVHSRVVEGCWEDIAGCVVHVDVHGECSCCGWMQCSCY